MAYSAPPARTEISDTYPNPSNAVARAGFGKLWDYVTGLLGSTGNPAAAKAALLVPQDVDFTNRIINGAMMIDQRNAGANVSTTGAYVVDRFQVINTGTSTFTAARGPSAPSGFVNSLNYAVGTGATVAAGDSVFIRQIIEGVNGADLAWGTASAQSVTVSFWVRSSLMGTFGVSIQNYSANRSYVASYTISAAATWEYKTITIPGDTAGTWNTDTANGWASLIWDLGTGTTLSGASGSWASANYRGLTGGTKVTATSGATLYITGVQLEKGTAATGFATRPYGTELALCQRYLPAWRSSGTFDAISVGLSGSTTGFFAQITYQVAPRVPPTGVVVSSASHFSANSYGTGGGTPSSVVFSTAGSGVAVVQLVTTGLTVGQSGNVAFNNASGYLYLTGCEL